MKPFPLYFTTVLALFSGSSYANEDALKTTMTVKPNRCVALRQGQVCYQKLTFTWSLNKSGTYCLKQQSQNLDLVCWKNNDLNRYVYKFSSSTDEKFYIYNTDTSALISQVMIKIAWVYRNKKRSPSGWRLF